MKISRYKRGSANCEIRVWSILWDKLLRAQWPPESPQPDSASNLACFGWTLDFPWWRSIHFCLLSRCKWPGFNVESVLTHTLQGLKIILMWNQRWCIKLRGLWCCKELNEPEGNIECMHCRKMINICNQWTDMHICHTNKIAEKRNCTSNSISFHSITWHSQQSNSAHSHDQFSNPNDCLQDQIQICKTAFPKLPQWPETKKVLKQKQSHVPVQGQTEQQSPA